MSNEKSAKKDWESFFVQCDQAGVPDDFMEDRDSEPPQERDELWDPADYDDEPRSHGNFGLDPQQQSAADAAKQREKESNDHDKKI